MSGEKGYGRTDPDLTGSSSRQDPDVSRQFEGTRGAVSGLNSDLAVGAGVDRSGRQEKIDQAKDRENLEVKHAIHQGAVVIAVSHP